MGPRVGNQAVKHDAQNRGDRCPFKTVRLADDAIEELLNQLDAAEAKEPGFERRSEKRHAYRRRDIEVELLRTRADPAKFLVPTRNISCGGLVFIHCGYVHPRTACRVRVTTLDGRWEIVRGVVAWCKYIDGRMHDVGVRFDNPIDVAPFVAPGTNLEDAAPASAAASGADAALSQETAERVSVPPSSAAAPPETPPA